MGAEKGRTTNSRRGAPARSETGASRTFFIEQSFPDRERVAAVLAELDAAGAEGRTTRELMAVVNLGMGRLEAMLKILEWRAPSPATGPGGAAGGAGWPTTASATRGHRAAPGEQEGDGPVRR